jgi:KaiC/GvpD/RAD55 family RecA-like ATPase
MIESLTHPTKPIGGNGARELVSEIEKIVQKNGIGRLVIDPATPVLLSMEPDAAREFLKVLGDVMYSKHCTTILTTDVEEREHISQVPCDGAIRLANLERHGDILRVLQVLKMAGVSHSRSRYAFDITSCGILMTPLLRGGRVQ